MAEDTQGDLPIEEIGIDLVVNAGDNFIGDMSKAGRQMTTFTNQIGNLVKALPELNTAFVALKTNLADINNRTGNVKNLAQALNQLGKMPNTVKNIGTNAANAAAQVDKLYTSLANAQARMKEFRTEEAKARIAATRKQGAPKGAESDPNSQNKGAKVTRSKVDPSTVAATTDTAAANREAQAAKARALAAAKIATQTTDLVRRVLSDPKNNDLSVSIQLDVEEGKIKEETAQALAAAVMAAGKAAGGPEARAAERIGVYIADGIGKGMSEAEDAVVKGSNDLAHHILTAMKSALGISSPSRAANQQVGQEIPPGVAEGIEEKTPVAEEAAREMARKVMAAAAEEGRARAKAAGTDLGASAGASMRIMMTKRMMADLKKLGYSEQEINVATPSQAGDIIGGSVTRGGVGATLRQATTPAAASAQQAGKDAGKKIVEQATKGVEQGAQSTASELGPGIKRKAAKIADELKQIKTGQGPLNDLDFETESGMNQRLDAALQKRLKASDAVRKRANKIIENNAEATAFLLSLDPEVRQALNSASRLRVVRKLTSNRGQNVLDQGAIEDALLTQMKVAGAEGTAPGTESLGSQKMRGAYVPALGRVARWKERRGGGVSMGHNAGKRDFTGALYQSRMQAFADQGGMEAALTSAKPDTPEWQALYKGYSPVTAAFPWQVQEARLPKNFKGDKDRLEQATAAAAKVIIKAMGLDSQAPTIQSKRLAGKKGSAQFEQLYSDMPEMQAFRDVNARDVKRYLREQLRVGIEKQRVVNKQGDPQIEQATSEYYQKAHEIIGRQDATLSEIISGLEEVNNQIRADLRAKFESTGQGVYKMLSERDDPVIRRTIDYLKKFGQRGSTTNPGQTIAEVMDAWADVWDFLKNKFGGEQGASQALSAYEEYVNKIETPAMRNDLMPDFPRGLQVRRVRGAPRPIDRKLADKHAQERLDAELAYRDQQHYPVSRIRNAVDFGDVQGSRKLITQFEQQRMQAQIPEAPGVDREKVLEASNSAITIEWELAAQEDAINKAAEAYAKKNGRTLKQVNQAVENVRTGKNKKPGKALTDLALMVAEYDKTITRWEAAVNAYLEKAIPAQQAASKSIDKGIAKGELRSTGAKYFDAEGNRVNPEGMNVRTRNLRFEPGGLVRRRDALGKEGPVEVFDTARTKREYYPQMLGATAEAAYAPAYKKPRGYRLPELTDKERIKRANRAADIQAELGGMYNAKLDQTYGGFKPPTKKAFAGGDLEKAARIFGNYSRDFNELLRIKTSELSIDVKNALDSINTAANNYIGSAIKYVDSFQRSGFLEKGAAEEFNAALIGAQAKIIDLKNRSKAGEQINPADVKAVVRALHERVKTMGMFMEASTEGLNELEKEFDKSVADAAAADKAKVVATQAGAWQAANAARVVNRQAAGWQAAQAGGQAAQAAAKQPSGTFTFPDDWVIRLVNAIGQAADKIVAAVRGIRIELTGGGVAENVGPTEAQKKAGRPRQTDAEAIQPLANIQADLIRTSEVDAYRAAHTAMRQVRQANDLNPNEVQRLQESIDAWRAAAIKSATDSIKMQANRGDVVDAFRSSRSQADLDLQKIVGPEIRKTINNQEKAVSEREMRSIKTAFDDIARAERGAITALQKSGAPTAQLEKEMKAISAAAELAREDVIGFSQSAESFQILDAQIDNVVNGFREMGEQAKFAARQADRTPLMQKELAIQTRKDSITRDAERLRSSVLGQANVVPPAELQRIVGQIDAVSSGAEAKLDALLTTAQTGGIGAEQSMAALNLELQKIRSNAAADIEVLRRLFTVTVQNARATAAAGAGTVTGAPKTSGGVSDVDRALGAGQRSFAKAATLGKRVLDEPYANQKTVTDLLKQLANVKAKTQEAIDKALANPLNVTGSEKANAVREAIQSTKADLDGITAKLHDIERASQGVTGSFQKIDHAAADVRGKIADLAASGRARIDSTFASSLAIDLDKTAASAVKKFEPTVAGIKTRLSKMYAEARQAALAGDKAAVNQLVWEIRKLTDAAEVQVDASLDRILARADQIDRQVKGMQQIKDWAKDPQSFLQERVVGKAKQGGVTGWINRARLNFQEADAVAEMFKNVQKAKLEMNNLDVILRTLKNTVGGVFFGIAGVFKLLSSPVWLPLKAGIAIFKGLSLAIDGVAGSFKKLRYMVALPGMKRNFAAGLNKDERGQQYADTYAQYTTLFEKMNRTQYSKATAGKKFFAMPGFDKASLDRQARDFGALQSAYEKLQKAAVKQGLMDKPVTAVGKAATVAARPVQALADVLTLGASASARETKKLNAEMARTGTTAEAAGVKVKRSGLFGAKVVSTQPRTADGRYAGTMGFNDIMSPASQANAKRGMKKLFADMGTGVGLGFGMSFSMGIINSIQNMAWRIQSTIGGIIANGLSALIETEMRKMTVQSFISQEMMDAAGPSADFAKVWTDAQVSANDYYKQIVDIAKVSSFSRTPLLDLFNNMQVGGLTADNAAAVTRAVTMFGDAYMPGNKQMIDTFGQQMSQMLNQGVAQQVDLKLLAQQGIPVYDMLAKNLPRLQGMGKDQAQGQIFDEISKGQLGATEALEAITKGMVDAASNMKGEAAKTLSGLTSTFQDLMLEKSEAIMQPVAENLMKPFIEFANDFLQSNPITNAITAFGQQINALSQTIMTGAATAMGVLYGLWNSLPKPIQESIKAIGAAIVVMGGLTVAIAAVAAVGALLAPMFGVITTGMLLATGAIGAFIGAWSTNLMGFRDWLSGWAKWAYDWAVYLGKSLADGLLVNVGEFSQAGAAAINGFMANFMGNMEAIYASVQSFGTSVGNAIGAGLEQIGTWVQAAIDWLWALPQNAWDVVESVVEAFWEVPKNLEGIGQAMWSWGENVVTMFAQGMQGAIDVVFDALQAIGNMFTEWLEPGSPPKLLPDLTVWGTGAADAYLEGWTKADYGVLNDLSSKLEEAFAIDEGAMKQGELAATRGAVADMIDKAIGGTVDTSAIMNAIPGWGGRAESVQRLADAYANLAVSQHALTVEQEALDRITAQYDARLKPLQSKLESIQNKQEALDLTSQIKEYQNVLDNVYATDQQKEAAKLKMEELKLSQQINNVEIERDKLTDPINDRIGQLAYENLLAQDGLDIALERWNVEVGMLKAGQKKEQGGGAEGTDAAGKDPKDKAGGAGTEKNRQFTQPKLNVPGITGKNGLGAIGSKMQELSDKIKGYFSEIGEKAKPLADAIGGIGSGVTTIKDAIDAGFQSGAFSSETGFAGFLNNVGAGLAVVATNVTAAKTAFDGFVAAATAAWNSPFGSGAPAGPQTEQDAAKGQKDFGGFKQFTKDANEQATLVQRAQAVVTVVQENLDTAFEESKKTITQFATDISTAVSAIDWATITTNFQTGLGDVTGSIGTFAGDVQKKIAEALGMDFEAGDTVVDKLDKTTGKVTEKVGSISEGAGKLVSGIIKIVADKLNSYTMTDEQVTAVTAGSIIIIGETIKNLNVGMANFLRTAEAQELFNAAGKQIGQIIVGLLAGAAFGGVYEALKGQEVLNAQQTAKEAVNEMFVEFLKGLAKGLVDSAAEALGIPPDAIENITKAFGGEQIATGMENFAKAIEPLTTMGAGGPLGALKGGMQLGKNVGDFGYDLGQGWARRGMSGPGIYYGEEMMQMQKDLQAAKDAVSLQSQLAVANAQLFPTTTSGFDPIVAPPTRDKSQDNIKSILDVKIDTILPQLPQLPQQPPQGQAVPLTDVPQAPAWQTIAPPAQKAQKAPAAPAAGEIKMELGGLDPAKMFQAQVTAATTAGQAAGANFSKAYSTATTTALSTGQAAGKNVFAPVEKEAPKSATLTWSSFLAGLQQAGGSATTQTGAQGIGTDVIGGIAQGAMSAIGTSPLLALVPGLLIKFFQNSLGIGSPSLVFDQMVGQPIGQGIVQGIGTALVGTGAADGVQGVITTMFAGINTSMVAFGLGMQVAWLNLKTAVSGVLETLKSEWLDIFDTLFEDASTRFDEFAASWIEEKMPAFKDAIIELAIQAKEGFLDAMQEAVDGLNEKIQEMLDMLGNEDLLNEFYEKGQALGENIAEGIAAGMTSRHAAGEFAHAAEKIVDMINDAIAAAAQIESPSKVMAREIGIPLSAGIAVGMTSPTAQRYLEGSSENVIQSIVRNFQQNSASQTVTTRYIAQPEQNIVSRDGGVRNYIMNLSVTPQMAERVEYNFKILESFAS